MNVYYLPGRQQNDTPEIPLSASRWSVFQARAHRAWRRLRLTVSEIYSVVRSGGRNPLEDHIWLPAEEQPAQRRRTLAAASV